MFSDSDQIIVITTEVTCMGPIMQIFSAYYLFFAVVLFSLNSSLHIFLGFLSIICHLSVEIKNIYLQFH